MKYLGINLCIVIILLLQACSTHSSEKSSALAGRSSDYRAASKLETEAAPPAEMAEAEMAEEAEIADVASSKERHYKKRNNQSGGVMTAAEWNPFFYWNEWTNQQHQIYSGMRERWGLPVPLFCNIKITDKAGKLVPDCKVALMNHKTVLRQTLSDNKGQARLPIDAEMLWQYPNASINVFYKNKSYATFKLPNRNARFKKIILPLETTPTCNADIMFVVDATGSMGDEIQYLKNELSDVLMRVEQQNSNTNYRLGALFYRDKKDSYVTKSTPLDRDIDKTISFINEQNARGGGDYPEAVHTALDEAINQANWQQDAVARILFLVLDAPPHNNRSTQKSLKRSIRKAAEKGIRIIPVTASGIDGETEFLMKSYAMMTNGTYTFITDHSGVGNSHLPPAASRYQVEKLNDLMVRLINDYSGTAYCGSVPVARHIQNQTAPVKQEMGLLAHIENQATYWNFLKAFALFSCLYVVDRIWFW